MMRRRAFPIAEIRKTRDNRNLVERATYNLWMARGWESKSVEEQQSEAISFSESQRAQFTPAELITKKKREGIALDRKRVLQSLQRVENPQHRKMLEAALADLEAQLSNLG
jgi:hypothetical protein